MPRRESRSEINFSTIFHHVSHLSAGGHFGIRKQTLRDFLTHGPSHNEHSEYDEHHGCEEHDVHDEHDQSDPRHAQTGTRHDQTGTKSVTPAIRVQTVLGIYEYIYIYI